MRTGFSRRLSRRIFIISAFICVSLASSLAQAADPQLAKQISVLQRQVANLQKELSVFKAIINKAPDGTTRITSQQHKQEVTRGNAQTDIEGNQNLRISLSASEAIGRNQSLTVGTNRNESIGQDLVQKIGRNVFQTAGLDVNIGAGKHTIISAGDQLILRTGKASIVLNKNGDIDIKGKNIFIKGSGPVVVKGSKVTTN